MPALRHLPALLLLAAIWLIVHRYAGIRHDGLFYAVQALAHSDPWPFRHDLFFAFGSQDDYSLFSRPYAWLAERLGLGRAAFLLWLGAQALWLAAAVAIARRCLDGPARWIGLALLLGLPRGYGTDGVFQYAENFLTARVWAEALVLGGVAATLYGRTLAAVALTAAAAALHPIIALPGVLLLLAGRLHPAPRRFAVLPLVALLALLALAALGVAGRLPRIDGPWLAEVGRRAPFVLLDRWRWGELAEPLTWIGILLAAALTAAPPLRALYRGLALTGVAGIYLALLGTLTHAALLVQAQPWRCLWLVKAIGLLALAGMVAQRWRRSPADRYLLAGLAAAAITAPTLGGPVALLLAAVAHLAWRRNSPPPPPRWLPAAGGAALAIVLLETALAIAQQAAMLAERLLAAMPWAATARLPLGDLAAAFDSPLALLLPAAMGGLLWLTARCPASVGRTATAACAALLVVAAAGAYRADTPEQQALFGHATNQPTPARPFDSVLPRTATVLWHAHLLDTWFRLRQGHYASAQQGVGVVFSRATALAARQRLDRLAAAGIVETTPTQVPTQTTTHAPTPAPTSASTAAATSAARPLSAEGLALLCADPALDAVIHAHALPGSRPPRWDDPLTGATWYLSVCSELRPAPAAADPPPPPPPPPRRA